MGRPIAVSSRDWSASLTANQIRQQLFITYPYIHTNTKARTPHTPYSAEMFTSLCNV